MEKARDIRLDDDGDVKIDAGDFDIVDSDQIHIEHILISNQGYWFEHLLLGVGIIDEIKSSNSRQELKQNIRRQLVFDNFAVREINIQGDATIDIDALRRI